MHVNQPMRQGFDIVFGYFCRQIEEGQEAMASAAHALRNAELLRNLRAAVEQ
jgi:hypothetical protein